VIKLKENKLLLQQHENFLGKELYIVLNLLNTILFSMLYNECQTPPYFIARNYTWQFLGSKWSVSDGSFRQGV